MNLKSCASVFILLALAVAHICCKGNDSVSAQDETYIPLITNSWTDVLDPNHRFNLQADKDSVSSGTFTGNETTDDGTEYLLTGSFVNRNISFRVTRSGTITTYTGRFVVDTLMDFGTLKLFRLRQ